MNPEPTLRTIARGRHLMLVDRGGWEYVTRTKGTGVVALIAVTDEGELVLVEQHRPPVGRTVIELPAGVVGDVTGAEDESLEVAARRELLEETGYDAEHLERLFTGVPSAGITDEEQVFFLATGLRRVGAGGGDDSEDIRVHVVPVPAVEDWVAQRMTLGATVDARVYAGVHFATTRVRG